jgi:hypothetical protein
MKPNDRRSGGIAAHLQLERYGRFKAWLRCSLCGSAHECVIRICNRMRSYRFAHGRRCACIRAHLQSADMIPFRPLWALRRAMLCAGRASRARLRLIVLAAFALGSTGGECSPPFFRLDYEKACERAAVVANKTYMGSRSLEGYPVGCYWHTVDGGVYYFIRDPKHAFVTVNSFVRQMCAGKADSRTSVCDTCDRARSASGVAFLTCVREVWYGRPTACLPTSEHACPYAFCYACIRSTHPVHPSNGAFPPIHFHPSCRDPSPIPSFRAFCLACNPVAKCVLAAQCECSAGGSSGGSDSRFGERYPPDPHFLTLSCYGPGRKGWKRGLVYIV